MSNGIITFLKRLTAPSTPATGKASVFIDDSGLKPIAKYINDDGQVHLFGNIYGSNYMYDNAHFEDTNTTNLQKTYSTINYPSGLNVSGQKYEIELSSITRYSVGTRNFLGSVALDGVILEEEMSIEHKDSGADIRDPSISNRYIIDGDDLLGIGGTVEFQYRAQQVGDVATVHAATLTFKRVI